MKRSIAVLAAALTAGGLAGCTAWTPQQQADVTGQQFAYRPGNGVIESISRAPLPLMAGAGGTAEAEPHYRLAIRMDDGRLQYIDTPSTEFTRGMRVRLTDERLIEAQ